MKFVTLAFDVVIGLIFAATALAADTAPVGSSVAAAPQPTHDYTFSRSVKAVRHKLEQKQPVVIVDVRNRSDFDRLRISSAVNIPLYAVKTKSFLKTGMLVLANNGFNYGILEEESRRLKELGFDVSILRGGINAWLEADFPLTGDMSARPDIWQVEPRDVYQERQCDSFLAVNAAPEKDNATVFPDAVNLDLTDQTIIGKLKNYNKENPANNVLVFNATGEGYPPIKKKLLAAGVEYVFFLKGGLDGYVSYLHDLDLSRAPRAQRVKSFNKCKSCGD